MVDDMTFLIWCIIGLVLIMGLCLGLLGYLLSKLDERVTALEGSEHDARVSR